MAEIEKIPNLEKLSSASHIRCFLGLGIVRITPVFPKIAPQASMDLMSKAAI